MKELLLCKAEQTDLQEMYALMQRVHENMENKALFVCDDYEYVREHFEKKGFAIKACNEAGKIVGCFFCSFPGMDEENLGYDLGLSENELCSVVHMDAAVVDPAYRGQGLQGKMLCMAEQYLTEMRKVQEESVPKYRYYLATVSPDNPASFTTLEKQGYVCRMTKEKYGGLLRRIYCKQVKF